MKRSAQFSIVAAVAGLALVSAASFAATGGVDTGNPGFEKLKSLAGSWKGKDSTGHPVEVTYKVVSGGSALVEELSHEGMVTVYHADGDRVMMTHYCAAMNQPRMRTDPVQGDPKTLDFKFVDVTNLAKPDDPVMKGLKVTFTDANHFSQEWSFAAGGKVTPETMTYERQK